MSGKQISPREVFMTSVAPTASSISEAILQFGDQTVAAPGLWGSIKRTARKLTGKKSKDSSAPSEQSSSPSESTSTSTSTDSGGTGTSLLELGSGVLDTISTGASEVAEDALEYASQEPHVRLAHLYATLGNTDPLLDAIYADTGLRDAAIDLGYDRLVGQLSEATFSDAKVQAAPAAFASKLTEILDGLTGGSGMTPRVRTGLRRAAAGMTADQAMAAFGKRFNHAMTNNGGTWSLAMILAVWDQLTVLPDQDISDLTVLTTFQAIAGGGGFGPSWEAPDTVNTIQIGEDNDPAHVAHTVRHEIGHAVHAEIPGQINPWLQSDINFWFYNNDRSGLRQWVTELGGFPAKFTNPSGAETDWNDNASTWVLDMLKSYVGGGSSWNPARGTVSEGQGAWQTAYWDAMPDTVKDAVVQSPGHWYQNYSNFGQGTKGRYFLNYWYARPFYMSDTATQVVNASGDDYTAMSEKEFFANAYAEYFKDPAGYNDNSKWGGSLPQAVKDYFKTVIVDRQPYQAPNQQVQQNAQQAGVGTPPKPTGLAGTP